MLSPRYLAGISDDLVDIYAQLENDILADMARRIARMGKITDATKWQAQMLAESGGLKGDIKRILSKYDERTVQQVQSIFTEAMQKSAEADNRIFQEATGRMLRDNQAQAMLAAIETTHSDLSRLTQTTAKTTEELFVQQANAAYMEVSTGAFDYDTAMKHAADNLSARGITAVQYENGRPVTRTIESAVRMNILTGVNQTAATMTLNNCDELECDLVETSAHIGARPEHEEWQGEVFSISGTNKKYRPFSVCRYGEVDGICGINCRHSFYPYFEGMEKHYTTEDLDEMSKEKVTYNGRTMSRYDGEQTLRKYERNIRSYKRKAETREAMGQDATAARQKIGEWQAKARDFTQQTGIKRDYAREYIGTTGAQPKALPPKVAAATKQAMQQATKQAAAQTTAAAQTAADMNGKASVFNTATKDLETYVNRAISSQTMTAPQQAQIIEGQDLTTKVVIPHAQKDISDILKRQGFDGKPTVLSHDDFIQAVKDDTFVAQRTYTAKDAQELQSYVDMLRNGDFYVDCRVGGRAHGKGMYAAADYTKGTKLKPIVSEMTHYQGLGLMERGDMYTMTETMTLKPGARIIDEQDVIPEFVKRYYKQLSAQGLTSSQIKNRMWAQGVATRDVGVLAAQMGYDAIRAVPGSRADYMVILNRTKLVLLGGK